MWRPDWDGASHIYFTKQNTVAFVFFWLGSGFYLKAPSNESYCPQSWPSSGQTEIPFGGVSEEVTADFSPVGDD